VNEVENDVKHRPAKLYRFNEKALLLKNTRFVHVNGNG